MLAISRVAQGEPLDALAQFAILGGYGVFLILFSKRSETVAMLREGENDERRQRIIERSVAFAGHVLVTVLVGGGLVQVVRGEDVPTWWYSLALIVAVSFVGGLAYFGRKN